MPRQTPHVSPLCSKACCGSGGGGGLVPKSFFCAPKWPKTIFPSAKSHFFAPTTKSEAAGVGASNGRAAVSALAAVIACCPICQCSAEPHRKGCPTVHPPTLCPLAALASWALLGYACIQVEGVGAGVEGRGAPPHFPPSSPIVPRHLRGLGDFESGLPEPCSPPHPPPPFFSAASRCCPSPSPSPCNAPDPLPGGVSGWLATIKGGGNAGSS